MSVVKFIYLRYLSNGYHAVPFNIIGGSRRGLRLNLCRWRRYQLRHFERLHSYVSRHLLLVSTMRHNQSGLLHFAVHLLKKGPC